MRARPVTTVSMLLAMLVIAVAPARDLMRSDESSEFGNVEIFPKSFTLLPGARRTVYVRSGHASAITWNATGGSIVGDGPLIEYTAPSRPGNYAISVSKSSDSTKSATATLEVVPQKISISNIPAHSTIFVGTVQSVTAFVLGAVETNVTWTASGGALTGNGNSAYFSADKPGRYQLVATSTVDRKKSSTSIIDVIAAPSPVVSETMAISCAPSRHGATYNVGQSGSRYKNLGDVNWNALRAGDTVRIFARAQPYREQIVVSTQGTPADPIRICGVPDAAGNLPLITGDQASARSDLDFNTQQSLGIIVIYKHSWGFTPDYPRYIEIEGLALRSAWSDYSFIDQKTGRLTPYDKAAACIRVQNGSDIVIRGNDMSDCGNGIFTHAQVPEASMVRNLYIAGNYLHDNGVPRDDREHSAYLQAFGLVVEGNRFAPPRASSGAANLKTRSVFNVIRCNYIEGGARLLDMVEVQDAVPYALVRHFDKYQEQNRSGKWQKVDSTARQAIVAIEQAYHADYVYGNIFKNLSSSGATNLIHFGNDSGAENARPGTLYFFNNTVLALMDRQKRWRYSLFDLGQYGPAPEYPSAVAFNNLIELGPETSGAQMSHFRWNRYAPDRISLGVNYITASWRNGEGGIAFGRVNTGDTSPGGNDNAHVTGIEHLLSSSSAVIDQNRFVPLPRSLVTGQAAPLPLTPTTFAPDCEYVPDQHALQIRRPGGRMSLGAKEP